jgi:hypothetical protein
MTREKNPDSGATPEELHQRPPAADVAAGPVDDHGIPSYQVAGKPEDTIPARLTAGPTHLAGARAAAEADPDAVIGEGTGATRAVSEAELEAERAARRVIEARPHRDERGQLTRAGMEEVIRQGGSVMLINPKGERVVVDKVANLPTEADLARGDRARSVLVAESIDTQIAALQRERAKLEVPPAPVEDDAPRGRRARKEE